MKHKKLIKDFVNFIGIGLLWSGFLVIFMWLSVDILGISALISSTLSTIIVLIGRFYSYVLIGLIHPHFIKFVSTNISFTIANIALMTLAIDIMKINTVIASVSITGGLFLLKFIVFNKINLIKN